MSNNLLTYLLKNKFITPDLKKFLHWKLLFKPSNLSNQKNHLLRWLEVNYSCLDTSFYWNSDKKLFFLEDQYPNNNLYNMKILGFRFDNLWKKKINNSRVNMKFKKTIIIYWLEVVGSYRGWRHIQGLPVRGQRTWTNAWSVYKSNLDLREFILKLTKNIYKPSANTNLNTLRTAYMAEHINKLWAVQWELEWKKARKKRIEALKKNFKHYTVDLVRLASGNVNTKKIRKNRKKQAEEKKNIFYLGFDKGFTKYLLENNSLELPKTKKVKSKKKRKKKN